MKPQVFNPNETHLPYGYWLLPSGEVYEADSSNLQHLGILEEIHNADLTGLCDTTHLYDVAYLDGWIRIVNPSNTYSVKSALTVDIYHVRPTNEQIRVLELLADRSFLTYLSTNMHPSGYLNHEFKDSKNFLRAIRALRPYNERFNTANQHQI